MDNNVDDVIMYIKIEINFWNDLKILSIRYLARKNKTGKKK